MEDSSTPQATAEENDGSPGGVAVPPNRPKKRLALAVMLALGASLLVFSYFALTWPDVRELESANPATTAFIEAYRARAESSGQASSPEWRWVPYDSISPHLKRAVVVAEDIGFFSHGGFELSEIKQSIRDALAGERALRGASTITQQLAKNLWLSPSRNPLRKLKEAILTHQLERSLAKNRILELYLNVVEFGPGVYGAEAAARRYFGKAAADLLPEEAAQLAGGLPRPSSWNPTSENRWYRQYVVQIQDRMEQAAFLWRRI